MAFDLRPGCPERYRPSELADVLDHAADYIMKNGWRTSAHRHGKARCAIMAVCEVAHTVPTCARAVGAMTAQIFHDYGTPKYPGVWNDQQRDRRKVVRMMRRTARNLREHNLKRVNDYAFRFVK